MSFDTTISGPWTEPDQRIDRKLTAERLLPANPAYRDAETRRGPMSIEPDQQAILALERVSGAHVHRAKGLIQAYTNACYLGEGEIAEATKRDMTALAVRCIRESLSRDAA
jgi:hypothetical protein